MRKMPWSASGRGAQRGRPMASLSRVSSGSRMPSSQMRASRSCCVVSHTRHRFRSPRVRITSIRRSGEAAFTQVLKELRARHWVARGPFGWLALDRRITIELLRAHALASPLRTLFVASPCPRTDS
jgi:hypothetical protein